MHTEANEKASDDSADSRYGLATDSALESHLDSDPVYSYKEQRAIVHRIDRRLVVTCGLIYSFCILDRGNLGNASIAGLAFFSKGDYNSPTTLTFLRWPV